jgi:hypothetical protein
MTRFKGSLAILAAVVTAFVACTRPTEPTPTWALGVVPTPPPAIPGPTPPPPVSGALVGAYALTLTVGAACDAVPAPERTRAYGASVALGPRGLYVVTLSDARFLSGTSCTTNVRGLGCHQFTASEAGDTVRFHLEDLAGAHGSHILEQSASGAWIEITGEAAGIAGRPVIEAAGTGQVTYCGDTSAFPFPCRALSSCGNAELRMTLARR